MNEIIDQGLRCTSKNPQYAYLGPTYSSAKRVAWDILKEYVKHLPFVETNESELRVDIHRPHLGDKVRIILLGAENPDALRGMYLDGVVLDEYASMNGTIWTQVIRPMLMDRKGWAIFIGTPLGQNHFYDIYQYSQTGEGGGVPSDWYGQIFRASETGVIPKGELEAAKALMSDSEYQQEMECFRAGTLVTTSRGSVPIEEIRVGEAVLTHRNRWHMVQQTMKKKFTGEMIEIYHYAGKEPLVTTPEHPILVYKKESQARVWSKASELIPGDFVITPKFNSMGTVATPRFVELLGWYITEGSVSGNNVQFSLNPNNFQEIEEVTKLLEELGYKVRPFTNGSLIVCNTTLADTLVSLCGSLAENKKIPFDVVGNNAELLFNTIIRGDGHARVFEEKIRWYVLTTISKKLAQDFQILSAHLGRRSRIGVRPATKSVIEGREVSCAEAYSIRVSVAFKVNHSSLRQVFPTKLGIASRITEINKIAFTGDVFNLSVKQDESYVAGGVAVHNCSFSAALVGAYYGKEMDKAEQEGRITRVPYDLSVPVETYWDLGIDDTTVIWFGQRVGREVHWIDYVEESGLGLEDYIRILQEKKYVYGQHYLPHDAAARELGTGKTREEVLRKKGLGARTKVVPRSEVADGINAARVLIGKSWFDAEKCKKGIDALKNYERKWDSKAKIFQQRPLHNWASHGADAFRTAAMGMDGPEKGRDDQRRLPRYQDSKFRVV